MRGELHLQAVFESRVRVAVPIPGESSGPGNEEPRDPRAPSAGTHSAGQVAHLRACRGACLLNELAPGAGGVNLTRALAACSAAHASLDFK